MVTKENIAQVGRRLADKAPELVVMLILVGAFLFYNDRRDAAMERTLGRLSTTLENNTKITTILAERVQLMLGERG